MAQGESLGQPHSYPPLLPTARPQASATLLMKSRNNQSSISFNLLSSFGALQHEHPILRCS
jgi:hypothetical protein